MKRTRRFCRSSPVPGLAASVSLFAQSAPNIRYDANADVAAAAARHLPG